MGQHFSQIVDLRHAIFVRLLGFGQLRLDIVMRTLAEFNGIRDPKINLTQVLLRFE